jgi:hypothetical protein
MRLIDAEPLKELFPDNGEGSWTYNATAKAYIDAQPTVEPDIIRCKDCAYCDSDVVDVPYGMTKKVWWCDRLYAGANENLVVNPDDFCSWAERREK